VKIRLPNLTDQQRSQYTQLKAEVIEDIKTAVTALERAGRKLLLIRDQRLYREEFPTFDEFCRSILGTSRIQAHRLIVGWELVADLAAQGVVVLPDSERVARELSRYPKSDRKMIWQRALQLDKRQKPNYKTVRQAGMELVPAKDTLKIQIGEYKQALQTAKKTLRAGVDYSLFGRESMQEIALIYAEMQQAINEQALLIQDRINQLGCSGPKLFSSMANDRR
jgi:hypothetical protein